MVDDHGFPEQSCTSVGTEAGTTLVAQGGNHDKAFAGLPDDGLQGIPIHALVVSHGAYIRVAVRHFMEDLECSLPPGVRMSQLFSPCPNTGIARFVLTLSLSESVPVLSAVQCIFTNRKDHLAKLRGV